MVYTWLPRAIDALPDRLLRHVQPDRFLLGLRLRDHGLWFMV